MSFGKYKIYDLRLPETPRKNYRGVKKLVMDSFTFFPNTEKEGRG